MAEPRVWCWEASQGSHGPDWRLCAVLAPASAADLAVTAAQVALPGYAYCGLAEQPCSLHQQICPTHTFIDSASAEAYRANLGGGRQSNLWVYNAVELHRDLLVLESGYGGRGLDHSRVETALLLGLAAGPGVTLVRWDVMVGGEGYAWRTLAAGTGVDALLAYLA